MAKRFKDDSLENEDNDYIEIPVIEKKTNSKKEKNKKVKKEKIDKKENKKMKKDKEKKDGKVKKAFKWLYHAILLLVVLAIMTAGCFFFYKLVPNQFIESGLKIGIIVGVEVFFLAAIFLYVKYRVTRKILNILVVLILIAGACFGVKIYNIYKENGLGGVVAYAMGHDELTLKNLKPIRILIMGASDANQGTKQDPYFLTDTIMIAQYDPNKQVASIMSVPRDTYVGTKDYSSATTNYLQSYKINSATFNLTQIDKAVECVAKTTGLEIDNYIIIDTQSLIKLVDLIGGVDFDVPIDMYYDDDEHGFLINLKAGMQHIDGAKAEQLLRFRHNDDGTSYDSDYGDNDYGRMRTQREFIVATIKQAFTFKNILNLQNMVDLMAEDVTTNMDFGLLKDYIPYAISLDTDNLNTGVLPVTNKYVNSVSICIMDKSASKEVIANLFPPLLSESEIEEGKTEEVKEEVNASEVTISVVNASGNSENLDKVVSALEEKGFVVSKKSNKSSKTTTTTIKNNTNKSNATSVLVRDTVGLGQVMISYDNQGVDYSIIIGEDYNNLNK